VRAALALLVGAQQAAGDELLGREAAEAGDLVGALERREAGLSRTLPAPMTPVTGWVMVDPARGTFSRFLRASSVPFWIARGTSLALP